jgi:hypothetical protein
MTSFTHFRKDSSQLLQRSLYAGTRIFTASSTSAAATSTLASWPPDNFILYKERRVKAPISTEKRPGARGSPLNPGPPGPPHGYTERGRRPEFEISSRETPNAKDESFMHFVWHDWLAAKWATLWFGGCICDVSGGYRNNIAYFKETAPPPHDYIRGRVAYVVFIASSMTDCESR